MSSHDYVIANDTGANVRADLNLALLAIQSQNSGGSEPSTTYAYQWWADTTNDLLKQRNSSNNGWVSILTLSTGAVASGGIASVLADTTPQLGGDLDLNSSDITGTGGIPAGNLTGDIDSARITALPSISGASLTSLNADNISSGTLSNSRLSGVGILDTASNWTKGQRAEITALADGATITPDMDDSNNFSVTLAGNRTLANPSNLTAGQSGSVFITQDGTGSRTLGYGTYWDWADGSAPTLTTTGSATDRIDYIVRTTTSIHAVCTLAYS